MLRRNVLRRGSAVDKYTSIGADGFRQLMSRYYVERFSFDELDVPGELAARGVHDPELLPHYLYRDDALRAWRATASYCGDMLRLFYAHDDDVAADTELQVNDTVRFRHISTSGSDVVARRASFIAVFAVSCAGHRVSRPLGSR